MSDIARRISGLSPEQKALLEKRLNAGATAPTSRPPIAILGMGCRFPGGADSPDAFWRLLREGRDAIREVPRDRWDIDALYDPDPMAEGKITSRWGGFLDQVDRFDAGFFGISPREAVRLDPQRRLLLEVAWDALEDAGQTREGLAGTATGVFVGAHSHASDYLWLQYLQPDTMDAFVGTGTAHNLLAGRLSYFFDLHGPAVVVDTACSSSLVAVHLAVQSLRLGESDVALAAGVNLMLTPHFTIAASRMHMLAPDGRCKAFDHRADGFVRGEGCGLVVLKRLSDALAAGDPVVAVIRGSAINQDGHTNGITAPNGLAQRAVIERALKDAGVVAHDIGYVETHGTGTSLGDPIEIEALGASVGRPSPDGALCFIGSAKTNVGHMEGAAGIAGLIKAAIVLRHAEIPPLVHFTRLNPHIEAAGTRFRFPTEATPWPANGRVRRAGVSSFGWSGTNAHLVLEEAPPATPRVAAGRDEALVLPVSARSEGALAALVGAWRERVTGAAGAGVRDACFTAALRRSHHDHRLAAVGRTGPELSAGLEAALGLRVSSSTDGAPRVVFVFPGQGSQWPGMGRALLREEAAFREAIERCDTAIAAEAGWSLVAELEAGPEISRLREIDVVQPTLFAVEVALAALWRSWGVVPDAVIGHSMGEVAAAHVAGALSLEDATRVICRRSRLLRGISGRGAMAVVELSVEETAAALAGHEEKLSVAVSNGPRSTVISGDPGAIEEVLTALRARDVFCRPVKVDVASHSPQVDALRSALLGDLAGVRPKAAQLPIYSTVTASVRPGEGFDAEYWVRNLREPVRFFDALRALLDSGHRAFVEASPHPILLPAVEDAIAQAGTTAVAVPSLRREEDERATLLAGIAALYAQGVDPSWARLLPEGSFVSAPAYPWQRERFWLEEAPSWTPGTSAPARRVRDTKGWLLEPQWREQRLEGEAKTEPGHWLVFADAAGVGTELAACLRSRGRTVTVVPAGASPGPELERALGAAVAANDRLVGVAHLANLDIEEPSRADEIAATQSRGGYSVVALLQEILKRELDTPPRLWLVTRGAQPGHGGPIAVAQSGVWGLGRVLAEEHPECWGGLVDLDAGMPAPAAAALLGAELLQHADEDGVTLHGGVRRVLRLVPWAEPAPGAAVQCRPEVAYLVTGGLGGVGLEVARWLVGRGARQLVLAGRTELPPRAEWSAAGESYARQIAGILDLESRGARVEAPAVDVADERQVADLLEARRRQGLPEIRGVVHAAVVAEDRLLALVDEASFAKVLRPKVAGSFVLDRAFAGPEVDFFVLFSSLGSLLGPPGQGSYAAANAWLDALAHERRRRGRHALAVNWGAWAGLGLAQSEGARRTIEELERRGVASFSGPEGVDALGRLLAGDAVQGAVMPADWKRFAEVAGRTRLPSIVRDRVSPAADDKKAGPSLAERLRASEPADRRGLLEEHLRSQLVAVLRVAPEKVDAQRPMGSLGLESLTALELRRRLEVSLGIAMSATVMWNYPTLSALAGHLASRLGLALDAGAAVAPSSAWPAPVSPDVVGLSDEDALRALMGGKGGGA